MSEPLLSQSNVMALAVDRTLSDLTIPGSMAAGGGLTATQRPLGWSMTEARGINAEDAQRAAWMAAAQTGDRAAYEALLRDIIPLVRAIALRQGLAASRADDAVQDVLLTIHRARHTYDPARSFTAWLRVIAQRRVIDLMRRGGRQQGRELHAPAAFDSHVDESANPAAGLDRAATAQEVQAALATLPPRQREAVQHLVLAERSLADAAVLTRRSEGALKVNLHRALKALRRRFGARDDTP